MDNSKFYSTHVNQKQVNKIYSILKKYISDRKNIFGSELDKEDKYENVDLQKAIDSLEKEDRIVIVLRYYEDMKLEDIAVILDENLSTVKSRLYRSMRKLRLQMEPYDENA